MTRNPSGDYEAKIKELKLEIPPAPKTAGSYQPVIFCGNLAFLSGQISKTAEGRVLSGKVGKDLTLEEGKTAARAAALNALSVIHHFIGFSKFGRVLRVAGYVQTAPDFYEISAVVNGASDLFLEIFGPQGTHARSAVGMASLPLNAAVEIELTLEVKP
ncbi:MAG TPA: RidA family protein [bacterium]|nr:RidA family protein [bacterium]